MSVCACKSCGKLISLSAIPGSNPVAQKVPQTWANGFEQCPECGEAFCFECFVKSNFCSACPGPSDPTPITEKLKRLKYQIAHPEVFTNFEIQAETWFTVDHLEHADEQIEFLRTTLQETELKIIRWAYSQITIEADSPTYGFYSLGAPPIERFLHQVPWDFVAAAQCISKST